MEGKVQTPALEPNKTSPSALVESHQSKVGSPSLSVALASDVVQIELRKEDWYQAKLDAASLRLHLPQGWKIVPGASTFETHPARDNQKLLPLLFNSRMEIQNEKGTVIGALGYLGYDPVEGEKNNPKAIFSAVSLGSLYHFNMNSISKEESTDEILRILCPIERRGEADGTLQGAWTSQGALIAHMEKQLYVGMEFAPEVDALTIWAVVQSIHFN